MIYQSQYWFEILPKDPVDGLVAGKWLYFDEKEKLHALLEDLNELVEEGQIRAAKVARKLPGIDPFPEKPCVLCVFTSDDPKEKDRVRKLLKERFGIESKVWKSEVETKRDWDEGGWLRIQAELNALRRDLEAGRVPKASAARKRIAELSQELEAVTRDLQASERRDEVLLNMEGLRRLLDPSQKGVTTAEILPRLDKLEELISGLVSRMGQQEAAPESVPQPQDPNYVFIIMPFSEKHVDTYDAIKSAVKDADENLHAERVDERPGAVAITDEIHKGIARAGLIVCDLTEERPNVYYELGYARGLMKPMICIAKEGTTIHFDVYGWKTIFFRNYRGLKQALAEEIRKLRTPRHKVN